MSKTIKYTSPNGYTGILYGESSMSIGIELSDGSFKESLHTGFRNINTLEELKKHVDGFPNFMNTLFGDKV